MTTIGSTNPYYASLYGILGKNGGDKNASGGNANDYAAPRQSVSGGMTGSDTVFGAKLADSLWTMESQSVEIDQDAGDTWLGEAPSTRYEDEFMDLAKKTFAERIREQYLEDKNLTEDDLKTMSAEDREAIEADIRKAILEAMGVNGQKQEAAMDMGGNPAALAQGNAQKQHLQDGTKDDPLFSL
ncbi:hypothetical protein [Neorhizobium galegae]|uniref:hypothetical protein n=1 Tax=Neorhizobium galegae TaxID=399 RepID=UPI00210351B0|nr:hypothetical protein [Neorhizobium galegae]MCQ1833939.1 hypothetical protein [Neorhizobium galegae]UIY30324.1 hypothetical protein LZK73_06800 [Neorhizobium galegae]